MTNFLLKTPRLKKNREQNLRFIFYMYEFVCMYVHFIMHVTGAHRDQKCALGCLDPEIRANMWVLGMDLGPFIISLSRLEMKCKKVLTFSFPVTLLFHTIVSAQWCTFFFCTLNIDICKNSIHLMVLCFNLLKWNLR